MPPGGQGRRRAAAGEAGAADFPERERVPQDDLPNATRSLPIPTRDGVSGRGLRGQQDARDVDQPGAQVLAEALRLRVAPGGGGDAVAEEAVDDEVEAEQVRERVALALEPGRL